MQTEVFGTEPWKLARAGAPNTSKDAAVLVDTTRLERMVYDAIKSYGQSGCIADDLLMKFNGFAYSSITARFAALQRKGLIVCGPDTRRGRSKRAQRVMRALVSEAMPEPELVDDKPSGLRKVWRSIFGGAA